MHDGPRSGPPLDLFAQLERATALHREGWLGEARAVYVEILKVQPGNTEALRLLGLLNFAEQKFDEALLCMRKAVEAQPKSAEAHCGLADVLQATGHFEAACGSYRNALVLQPTFFEAQCNLGNALCSLSRRREAITAFTEALALRSDDLAVLVNLSIVYLLEDRAEEAITFAARAVQLQPRNVDANYNLGLAYEKAGQACEAIATYRVAAAQRPNFADPFYRLGRLLQAEGGHDEAIACFQAALSVDPAHADSLLELGVSLKALERWDEARRAFLRHAELQPKSPAAWSNIGATYQGEKRFAEAISAYEKALALAPKSMLVLGNLSIAHFGAKQWAEAERVALCQLALQAEDCDGLNNLGLTLAAQNRLAEAEAVFRRALGSHPKSGQTHCNLGNLQFVRGETAMALASYRTAGECDPKLSAQVACNEAIALLRSGDYRAGWAKYENRYTKRTLDEQRRFAERRLQPDADLAGKTVLVYAEQGLGDTLQFIRYIPLLAARGATVHVEVQRPLLALLGQIPGAATVFAAGEPVPFCDFQSPMLSLPHILQTEFATIPGDGECVVASAERIAAWQARLAVPGLKIGIVWAGNPLHENDHNRSVPFTLFRRLFATAGTHFFSLQKIRSSLEAQALRVESNVTDLAADLRDFADTAAVIAQLDLVIAVDTSAAHLAGALGKPVWILLPHAADWRWLTARDDSPWYPSARLFRQPAPGDWRSVLDAVAAALRPATARAAA